MLSVFTRLQEEQESGNSEEKKRLIQRQLRSRYGSFDDPQDDSNTNEEYQSNQSNPPQLLSPAFLALPSKSICALLVDVLTNFYYDKQLYTFFNPPRQSKRHSKRDSTINTEEDIELGTAQHQKTM